tara:strand:- start:668 stop:1006 length:339 start_codon:yes stop_codon:yes gene_type:complete
MTLDELEMISVTDQAGLEQEGSKSSLLYRTFQKPLGIGILVGIITGICNSLILGLPLISSIGIGAVLGISVCIFGCPGMMRGQLQARRELEKQRRVERARRQRIMKAFTSFD